MAADASNHMLSGYKVLDFTQYVAGPTVTRLMAEMGAEIIKVELAPNGDLSRTFPYIKDGRSAYFVQQNQGKLSLCVDIKHPAGKEIVRDLIPKVDVLVQNYAPGVIARMGFDYKTARQLNPHIIMCSVSTFGQSGPLAHQPGYDFIGQAYAGVTSLSGEEGGDYFPPITAIGDVSTGVHAYAAVATALLYRERTGKGQHLDLSLLDSYFHYLDGSVELLSASRGAVKVRRTGNTVAALSPASIFRIRDGALWVVAFQDNHWANLCHLMGRPELTDDPRTISNLARVANRKAVNDAINDWLSALSGIDEALRLLQGAHIPHAPILTVEQAMAHPHLRDRRTVRTIRDRIIGEFQVPGFPLRFSEFPGELDLEAPFLGEHNRQILTEYLGYSDSQIDQLERNGALKSAPH